MGLIGAGLNQTDEGFFGSLPSLPAAASCVFALSLEDSLAVYHYFVGVT